MHIRWSPSKSEELKRTRGVSFEDILKTELVAIKENPGRANQDLLMFNLEDYIWVVPCVENGDEVFLKTLYPSRKYTRMWKAGELS